MRRWSLLTACLSLAAVLRAATPAPDAPLPGLDSRAVRNALLAQDGVLYVGGSFTQVGGQPRTGLAAIEISTGKLLPWAPALRSAPAQPGHPAAAPSVAALAWKDGLLYVGGTFQAEDQPYLAAFSDARLGPAVLQAQWRPRLDAPVADIQPAADKTLYIAGRFTQAGGLTRTCVAQLEDAKAGPGRPSAFNVSLDRRVCTLALDAEHKVLLAGGLFKQANGQPRPLLVRLDAASGQVLPGQLTVSGGPNQEILRMLLHHGSLYAAGVEIASVQDQPRLNAFAIDPTTFTLKPFRADLDAGAGALSAFHDTILIGGDFQHVNGLPRRVAKLDAATGKVLDWDPLPNHNSYAALMIKGRSFLSGYWTHLGPTEAGRLAAFDEGDGEDREAPRLAWVGTLR